MVKLTKVEMTEQDLAEKKLHLEYCKNQKDSSDIELAKYEEMMKQNIPARLLDDDIKRLAEDIKNREVMDGFGKKIDATDSDVDRMKIMLKAFKAQKKADLPNREMRLKVNQLREAKARIDAPEQQIKKLVKEVREKSYYITAKEHPTSIS